MKIRDKLFLGFGLYIFLAVILGFFAYKELRNISAKLVLVETADDVTNTILEVRRYEKNFLLFKDRESFEELQKYLITFKKTIDDIKAEIVHEIGGEHAAMMKQAIAEYERLFTTIAANYTSQKELEDIVRIKGKQAERVLSSTELQAFQALRRQEKNIMMYKNRESYSDFMRSLNSLSFTPHPMIWDYQALVAKLYALYEAEKSSLDRMRSTARDIQAFTQNLSKKERSNIAATIKTAINLKIITLVLLLIVGTVINIKLATSIAKPILDLERITKKITRGDFSEVIAVKGSDEIASLALSFNQMELNLDHAMTSLEEIIKKLQEKQDQLVEAEKLASVGKLAAGIAHEINNPLTSVLTFSILMLEQCPQDDPRHDKLKLMVRETERARTIVRQLQNFGREIVIRPVRININDPVKEIAESLVSQGAFTGIELSMKLTEGLPEILADPAQIGQVVMNILLNAIHAITPPGRIELTTRLNGNKIEVVFTDTGKGIAGEHLHKVFDPFFTTKEASKGTGLGLAVSYGII